MKKISFSNSLAADLIEEKKWAVLAKYLNDCFKIERSQDGSLLKFEFNAELVTSLFSILETILKLKSVDIELSELLTATLKALRNCCSNVEYQNHIANEKYLALILEIFTACYEQSLARKMLLQFVVNLIASNKEVALKVYDTSGDLIIDYFNSGLEIYESSALLYNIFLHVPFENIDLQTVKDILKYYSVSNDIEYLQFLLEKLIQNASFWDHYQNFTTDEKITSLEIIKELLLSNAEKEVICDTGFELLLNQFLNANECIFQTVTDIGNDLEPYEVSLILKIISTLSSRNLYMERLQLNKNVLITAGILLLNLHRLGKMSDNCFTAVQKLSEICQASENITHHPAFGFKADLVRLIGNLCWKNKKMQDLVREAEVIPVLLDSCNIDGRNPFIMQWVILAIRNLCEDNLENQAVIAGMKNEGTVSSAVLEQLGLTLHSDSSNEIKVISLDALRIN